MRSTTLLAMAAGLTFSSAALGQTLDLGNLENTVSSGLSSPVGAYNAPGEAVTRLYIVNSPGTISLAINGTVQGTPFLNLASLSDPTLRVIGQTGTGVNRYNEQGLLGMAFDPDYNTPGSLNNGYFYIYYIAPRGSTYVPQAGLLYDRGRVIVARVKRSAVDPNQADLSTFKVIMTWDKPEVNHNGGNILFGPDGLMYLGCGDGGGSNDNTGATNNALNPTLFLGKLLRIDPRLQPGDVPASFTYRIPAGNPASWLNSSGTPIAGTRPELWAKGLRNPWRWSFDRLASITGDLARADLVIADVGQNVWEEVNFVASNPSGINYGWRYKEGQVISGLSTGTQNITQNLVDPVYVYSHGSGTTQGFSITGGFIYRGTAIPGWRGRYFFADYVNNRIWSMRIDRTAVPPVYTDFVDHTTQFSTTGGSVSPNPSQIASFAEDNNGELYLVQLGGRVRKIVPSALSLSLNLADVAQIGGAIGPDGQLTVDDLITFVNNYSDGEIVPSDITGIGGPPAGPDNQLTVDDLIEFVNSYSQ